MEFILPPWAFALLPAPFLLAALFWGAPVIALVSELVGMVTKKPFPIRVGQHGSRLAVLGHALFWILVAGVAAWQWPAPWASDFAQANQLALLLTFAVPMLGSLFLTAYDLTWKGSKERRAMHFLLGALACLTIKYGYWGLAILALLGFRGIPLDTPAFIPTASSALWPLFALWMPLSLSLAAGLGLCYLVARRSKDDWGRDYYRFAAPFLAKWHILTGLCALGLLVWLGLGLTTTMNLFLPQILYSGVASVVCLVLGMGMSTMISVGDNPMRMKVAMLGVTVLNYLHVGLLLVAACEILTHYIPGWNLPTFVPALLQLARG